MLFDSSPEQQQFGFEYHISNFGAHAPLYPCVSLGVCLFLLLLGTD